MIRNVFSLFLALSCFGSTFNFSFAADDPDLAGFNIGELMAAKPALRGLERMDKYYATVTTDGINRDVLRFSHKPLSKAAGRHPEAKPPSGDFPLDTADGKNERVVKLIKARVIAHNKAVIENHKKEAELKASFDPSYREATKDILKQPDQELTDLHRLLRLISQGGVVNHSKLAVSDARLHEGTAPAWIKEAKQLASSAGSVGEAAKKLQPAIDDLQAAVDDYHATVAAAKEAADKLPKDDTLTPVLADAAFGYSAQDLENMKARGGEEREQAEEYERLREEARFKLVKSLGERLAVAYIHGAASDARIYRWHNRANVRRHAPVVPTLLPALLERAGPNTKTPELDVLFCALPSGSPRHPGEKFGYVVIHSKSAVELTKLTLLLKIDTAGGTRFATYYLPSLPPRGSARFEPVTLDQASLKDDLRIVAPQPEITQIKYAAWCTQFHTGGQEVKQVTPVQLVTDVWLQTVQPGLVFASHNFGYGAPQEEDRRFELVFRKLKPEVSGYSVEFDITDHDNNDKVHRCTGTMTIPPVRLGKYGEVLHEFETTKFGEMQRPEDKAVMVTATSGNEQIVMELGGQWNGLERRWMVRGGPASGRVLVPSSQVADRNSPEMIAKRANTAAFKLTQEGKFDEAKKAYEKVIKDFPGTNGAKGAELALGKLDEMKANREKLQKMQEERKKSGKPTRPPRVPGQ